MKRHTTWTRTRRWMKNDAFNFQVAHWIMQLTMFFTLRCLLHRKKTCFEKNERITCVQLSSGSKKNATHNAYHTSLPPSSQENMLSKNNNNKRKSNMRSTYKWFTESHNSQCWSHFAVAFIVVRAQTRKHAFKNTPTPIQTLNTANAPQPLSHPTPHPTPNPTTKHPVVVDMFLLWKPYVTRYNWHWTRKHKNCKKIWWLQG